jgi:hypothetical protein
MSEGIDDAQKPDILEFVKEQDPYARDADLILDRLEQVAEDDSEMSERLQCCREVRKRLNNTFLLLTQSPLPLERFSSYLNENEKQQIRIARAKVLEEMKQKWEELFSPNLPEQLVANVDGHQSVKFMLQLKTHELLDDQIKCLEATIRVAFTHLMFDEIFKRAKNKLFPFFPEDFHKLLRPETVDHIREVTSLFGFESIFARFYQLRTQVISLSREARPLRKHESELAKILKAQLQQGLTRSQRGRIQRWVNELFAAKESLIPDQIPLREHELKGANFSFVIDPKELQGEGKRLQALDIVQSGTLHAIEKLFQAMQSRSEEDGGDEKYYDEEEDFDPYRN